ncbi:MAG: FxsA family protein [Gammaproteobacteria bacterium]|nr:FxsA family protein [Gammaproteobacteria bacterium]
MWFLALLSIPVVEIYLFIEVGGRIGAWPTLALVISAAVLGVTLLRALGGMTLRGVQMTLNRGELPAVPVLEGLVRAVAAILLIIPGFLTDALALLMLIGPLRRVLIRRYLVRHIGGHRAAPPPGPRPEVRPEPGKAGPRTIDGEYWRDQ